MGRPPIKIWGPKPPKVVNQSQRTWSKLILGIARENMYPKLVSKCWGLPPKKFEGGQSLEISILKLALLRGHLVKFNKFYFLILFNAGFFISPACFTFLCGLYTRPGDHTHGPPTSSADDVGGPCVWSPGHTGLSGRSTQKSVLDRYWTVGLQLIYSTGPVRSTRRWTVRSLPITDLVSALCGPHAAMLWTEYVPESPEKCILLYVQILLRGHSGNQWLELGKGQANWLVFQWA